MPTFYLHEISMVSMAKSMFTIFTGGLWFVRLILLEWARGCCTTLRYDIMNAMDTGCVQLGWFRGKVAVKGKMKRQHIYRPDVVGVSSKSDCYL